MEFIRRHLPMLLAAILWLGNLPVVCAASPEKEPVAPASGRPWWYWALRFVLMLVLVIGAWNSWRNRKQP
jgi:hypothetical protein